MFGYVYPLGAQEECKEAGCESKLANMDVRLVLLLAEHRARES